MKSNNEHIKCLNYLLNALKLPLTKENFYKLDFLHKIESKNISYIICGGSLKTNINGLISGFEYKCLDCPFLCVTDDQIELYKADLRFQEMQQEMQKIFYFDNNPTLKIPKQNLNFEHKAQIKKDNELFGKIKTIETIE